MNTNEAKETAKLRLEEYLNTITTKKGNQYNCPICGSGTGKNKTPAGSITPDKLNFHCFSCNFHGDIFELVGKIENITDSFQKFSRAYEILGIKQEKHGVVPAIEKSSAEQISIDYSKYYKICHDRVSETDYFSFRGLSKITIDRFSLGFDPEWRSPKALRDGKNPPFSSRIIIPTSKYSYLARTTDPNADPKFKVVKEGKSELFNKEALFGNEPVFVVEGEIDALSVIEVGGQAIALGSTGNKTKFIELCKTTPPKSPIILSLDNDDAGRKTQSEIANALKSLRIAFLEANINGIYKDPNEHLTSEPDAFRAIIHADYMSLIDEEFEAAREKYKNATSAIASIKDFVGNIKASVDTLAIPTAFTQLDEILDEGLYEGLYVIGAISSLGKTSFALQMADQIAQQGQDVLIFSLEMARSELIAKSISRTTFLECGGNVNHAKTTRGIMAGKRYAGYNNDERTLINDSIKKYESYAGYLYIYEGIGDIGTPQVREIAETHINVTKNKPVILIDYLQILAPNDTRGSDKQNTDKTVFELKRLSRDFKIPVIGVSSLNRENYTTAINMSAFKESGAIEYSSDVLLGLQLMGAGQAGFDVNDEKKKDPRKIELKVLKNRNGATGDSVYFDYFPKFNYFRETTKKVAEDNVRRGSKRV